LPDEFVIKLLYPYFDSALLRTPHIFATLLREALPPLFEPVQWNRSDTVPFYGIRIFRLLRRRFLCESENVGPERIGLLQLPDATCRILNLLFHPNLVMDGGDFEPTSPYKNRLFPMK
jgi:hypothetical protein